MRVLTVIDSLAAGGAESSLAAVVPHLIERGVMMDVLTLHDRPGVQQRILDAGGTVRCVGTGRNRAERVRHVRSAIADIRPDVVHTTLFEADLVGRLASRLAGVPVVSSVVNEAYGAAHEAAYGRLRVRKAQATDLVTSRLVRAFHMNSRHLADVMGRRLRVPARKITVIHRGRDRAALGARSPQRREQVRVALGLRSSDPMVLAVARQEHQKAFDVLLHAMTQVWSELPAARLFIAGRPGDATPHLLTIPAAGDARVSFLGHRTDVADLLCAADLIAFPSRREGFPGTLVEAMALGCPIVASDIPQNAEAVDDVGVLVPVDDAGALARGILRTLTDPEGAARGASAGVERFEANFRIERIADQTVEWYHSVLDGAAC